MLIGLGADPTGDPSYCSNTVTQWVAAGGAVAATALYWKLSKKPGALMAVLAAAGGYLASGGALTIYQLKTCPWHAGSSV